MLVRGVFAVEQERLNSERDEAHALRCQLEYRSLYNDSSEAAMGELFDRLLLLLRDQGVQGLIASALPELNAEASTRQ